MAKKKNGNSQPQPLSVGKFVDRVLLLRAERESAVDRVRSDVEHRFRLRENKLLERVPDEKRMIAQAMLLAAEEQRAAAERSLARRVEEPPV